MRKKKVIKRHPVKPDKKFASTIVSQLINKVMKAGEKRKAMKIIYQSAAAIESSTSSSFLTILEGAVENVKPSLETRSRRMGGSNQRIPIKVEGRRALTLALRWMVRGAQGKKSSKSMFERLAEEIKNAYNKSGEAFKKKETIHKEAMSNMAFASALNQVK